MDKIYNIKCGMPLILDHEYAHCANTVEFQGFGKVQEISSIYLLLGKPVQLKIPLTEDFKVLVTAPITRKAGRVKAQLMECKLAENSEEEYEFLRYSDIFEVVITPSLAEESEIEVTDPRLELIYTEMLEAFQEMPVKIDESVQNWLDEHPEATTTVQDGAITESKIAPAFLPIIKNEYVTPEMFGAAGDGATDDSVAIQNAINTGMSVYFGSKTYLVNSSLLLPSKQKLSGSGVNTVLKTTEDISLFCIDTSSRQTKIHVHISNMTLLGNNQGAGIEFKGDDVYCINDYHFVQNVYIDSFTYGVKITGRLIYSQFNFVDISRCDYGIYSSTQAFNTNVFTQLIINACNIKCVHLGVDNVSSNFNKALTFINCTFENAAKNAEKDGSGAVEIYNAALVRFINCWFEGNFENTSYSDTPSELLNNNADLYFRGTFMYWSGAESCTFQRTGGSAIKVNVTQAYSNRIGANQYSDKCSYQVVTNNSNNKQGNSDCRSSVASTEAKLYVAGSNDNPSFVYDIPRGYAWIPAWVTSTVLDGINNKYITRQISSDLTITEILGAIGCELTIECYDSTGQYSLTLPDGLGTLTHNQSVDLVYKGYPLNRWSKKS